MAQGDLLWEPDSETVKGANVTRYGEWLRGKGKQFNSYDETWAWSVSDLDSFWSSLWAYFGLKGEVGRALSSHEMPGTKWFEGSHLNYSGTVFRTKREGAALVGCSEDGHRRELSWTELERKTSALSESLRRLGVVPGDRVGAYLPNTIEAAVGFLACAGMGVVWSACSPEFGAPAVLDRFRQIEPKVLLAVDGYSYGGRWYDKSDEVNSIARSLPSLQRVIGVGEDQGKKPVPQMSWEEATSGSVAEGFEDLHFDHPLWILYSSGTTGLPKPIVHGHGGIVLEHLKYLAFHNDVKPGDRLFWFTTTGWMMWNYIMGGLLVGATVILYDGSPGYPDQMALWDLAEKEGINYVGVSAAYLSSCLKAGLDPRSTHDMSGLRGIGSTGSPLSPEAFEWAYGHVKDDLWLASVSGGTDLCTPFVGGCPTLPVYSGEIQCRCLGAKVEAFDEQGRSVVGQVGELVITEPMPSMPLSFWGDTDGRRYRESYFETFPGVWRHGDWIEVTKRGTCIVSGRSDATIKRMGVRIGTSEIYRAVESLPEVVDSLAVDLEAGGSSQMLLFVATGGGASLDEELRQKIRQKMRSDLSPRYVPDVILQVSGIPRTLNGKKLEVPIKKVLMGADPGSALNRDSLANPESVDQFIELGRQLRGGRKV